MTFTYERKIDALGGAPASSNAYDVAYHAGYTAAVTAAIEIGADADEMIKELMDTIDGLVRPDGYTTMARAASAAEILLNRIEARMA